VGNAPGDNLGIPQPPQRSYYEQSSPSQDPWGSPAFGNLPVQEYPPQNPLNEGPAINVNSLIVFFTVKVKEDHKLAQIETYGLGDDEFFGILKREYLRFRGIIRRVFSIWRYAGSDFVKVCSSLLHE
jgi:hypothetical protein